MSGVIDAAQGGRNAAIAHRKALSIGKAALPPAQERVRVGKKQAVLPDHPRAEATSARPSPHPQPDAQPDAQPRGTTTPKPGPSVSQNLVAEASGGRLASMQRRRQLSIGKSALLGSTAVVSSSGFAASGSAIAATGRSASIARRRQLSIGKSALSGPLPALPVSQSSVSQGAASQGAAPGVELAPAAQGCAAPTCRDQARARRAAIASGGRAGVVAPAVSASVHQDIAAYTPKVSEGVGGSAERVTSSRTGEGRRVTGDDRATLMPISGAQYMAADGSADSRSGAPKVGLMRTASGQTVSGTLVRSQVRVTGDEAGGSIAITGKADQRLEDDLTTRTDRTGAPSAQFQRQANPQGGALLGGNLGRSVRSAGSRDRSRSPAVETTERGQTVTGSALGRSSRMTGDETGACRTVTGNQYMAPARANMAAGNPGGTPFDPVAVTKVSHSESRGGQRISGMNVEHNPRVTGDEPGRCPALTGSQYKGAGTFAGTGGPASFDPASGRNAVRAAGQVTGNTPRNCDAVTGTARGAGRDITGTRYYAPSQADEALPADPVATLDTRFSVRSVQRAAHLQADRTAPAQAGASSRITGSFAVGQDKVTGNLEFLTRTRAAQPGDKPSARNRVSGEGIDGGHITGDAWGAHSAVTGTEGANPPERNPTLRGPKAKAFAGSTAFKSQAVYEEPKQLVTGMFYFAKTGARVTLSGGAQG